MWVNYEIQNTSCENLRVCQIHSDQNLLTAIDKLFCNDVEIDPEPDSSSEYDFTYAFDDFDVILPGSSLIYQVSMQSGGHCVYYFPITRVGKYRVVLHQAFNGFFGDEFDPIIHPNSLIDVNLPDLFFWIVLDPVLHRVGGKWQKFLNFGKETPSMTAFRFE